MVMIVFGLLFVAAGGLGTYQGRRLNRKGERVTGTVVDVEWQPGGQGGRIPYPILEFRGSDGRVVRAKSRVGGVKAERGQQVPVLYDPGKPDVAVIDTWGGRANWLPFLFVVVGLGVVGFGIFHG